MKTEHNLSGADVVSREDIPSEMIERADADHADQEDVSAMIAESQKRQDNNSFGQDILSQPNPRVIDYVANAESAREINSRPVRSEQMTDVQKRAAGVLARGAIGTVHTFRTDGSRDIRQKKSA